MTVNSWFIYLSTSFQCYFNYYIYYLFNYLKAINYPNVRIKTNNIKFINCLYYSPFFHKFIKTSTTQE